MLLISCSFFESKGQTYQQEIATFQQELNAEFLNPEKSPLTEAEREKFEGHNFFPVNPKFRVEAKFIRTKSMVPFTMKTTTDRLPTYTKYGEAVFEIDGETFKLSIYQSHKLRETEAYRDYLFLPFTDQTNGETTYGGGRYLDLRIPSGDTIVIDFNKAYSPSCAYNYGYSCPIPPKENHMDISISAGVKNLEL